MNWAKSTSWLLLAALIAAGATAMQAAESPEIPPEEPPVEEPRTQFLLDVAKSRLENGRFVYDFTFRVWPDEAMAASPFHWGHVAFAIGTTGERRLSPLTDFRIVGPMQPGWHFDGKRRIAGGYQAWVVGYGAFS